MCYVQSAFCSLCMSFCVFAIGINCEVLYENSVCYWDVIWWKRLQGFSWSLGIKIAWKFWLCQVRTHWGGILISDVWEARMMLNIEWVMMSILRSIESALMIIDVSNENRVWCWCDGILLAVQISLCDIYSSFDDFDLTSLLI